MRIVILEAFHSNPGDQSWSEIEALGELTVYERTSQEQLVERAIEADVLVTNKLRITKDVIHSLPKLKLIHQLATGTDNIDIEAAKARGVEVRNAVGYSTKAVAQHVFSLILELSNHVSVHNTDVKSGGWSDSGDWCHMIKTPFELEGKTLGIIGFGQIGQAVSNLGLAFGMRILVNSKHATPERYKDVSIVSQDKLIEESDFISIHAPLSSQNMGMVDESFLNKMKTSAFLINTARGGHIVETDLYKALKNKEIAGAGLDVMLNEPPQKELNLLSLDNCIITPHIAWTAIESRRRLISIVAGNIKSFIDNHS
ncbi:MAG: D-2-hydroxyacid dehydrogenase [Cyclobacteriaceae bacterium]